jgi:hypothetical protein
MLDEIDSEIDENFANGDNCGWEEYSCDASNIIDKYRKKVIKHFSKIK